MPQDKLQKFKTLMQMIQKDTVRPQDIERFLLITLDYIKKSKEGFDNLSKENIEFINKTLEYIKSEHYRLYEHVSSKTASNQEKFDKKFSELKSLVEEIRNIEIKDGVDGKNGDNGKDGSPDTPSEIVTKLESLKGNDRLDASAIKGLPEFKRGKYPSGNRFLSKLADVSISSLANEDVLKWNSTTNRWENGTGADVSTLVPYTGATEDVDLGAYNIISTESAFSLVASFRFLTNN